MINEEYIMKKNTKRNNTLWADKRKKLKPVKLKGFYQTW